jgi:hypothetical protein
VPFNRNALAKGTSAHTCFVAIDKQRGRRAVDPSTIDMTVKTQQREAVQDVARLREVHPGKSPEELLAHVSNHYLKAAKRIGAKAGQMAIARGSAVQATADSKAFKQRSALYVLTVAEIHNLHPEDYETRSDLVEIVFAADWISQAATSEPVMGRPVSYWTQKIVEGFPEVALKVSDVALGDRYALRQALAMYGPDAIRIGIGSLGYWSSGQLVVRRATKMLGPIPEKWSNRNE